MAERQRSSLSAANVMDLLARAGRGLTQQLDRMPLPTIRMQVPMRDGVRLDTWVWLPETIPAPAILLRTPYREDVVGWARLNTLSYRDAGYAVVFQLIRGTGASEGTFAFNSPLERTDGYDAVEWVASQPWCDEAVGMDGASYLAMAQLNAAVAQPPHLRCIVPTVPAADFFRDMPYAGGAFSRLHTINWARLISIDSLAELGGGFIGTMPILSQPEWLSRMTSRPVREAARGILTGDKLQHYEDVLAHPTFDDWWRERTIGPSDYAKVQVPVLVIGGNFDTSSGALTVWQGLEANAPAGIERSLLIGPWDHGQAYVGGASRFGPYELGEAAVLDMVAVRLAFFDRHLRNSGEGLKQDKRARVFIVGANEWRGFDCFPPPQATQRVYYLSSDGGANSARGNGRLTLQPGTCAEPADHFVSDPTLPFVASLASADSALSFDMREAERHYETLVYSSAPLERSLTLLGEPLLTVFVASDAPDCDVMAVLVEHRSNGHSVRLATGTLRLRYRQGFEQEVLLDPGVPVRVSIPLSYLGHRVDAGHQLRLFIGAPLFPLVDPNPNTGEPIATAVRMRSARVSVLHDATHASFLRIPETY